MAGVNSTVLTIMAIANTIRSDSVIYAGLDRVPIPSTKEVPLQNRVFTTGVTPNRLDDLDSHISVAPDRLDSLDPNIGGVKREKSVDSAVTEDSGTIHKSLSLEMPTAGSSGRTSVAADGQNSHLVIPNAKVKDSISNSNTEVKNSVSSSNSETKVKDSAFSPETKIKDLTLSERNSILSALMTTTQMPSQERTRPSAATEPEDDHPTSEMTLVYGDVEELPMGVSISPARNEGLASRVTSENGKNEEFLANASTSPSTGIGPHPSRAIKRPEDATSVSSLKETSPSGNDSKPLIKTDDISSLTQVTNIPNPKTIEVKSTKIANNSRLQQVHSPIDSIQPQTPKSDDNTSMTQITSSVDGTEKPSIKESKGKTPLGGVQVSTKKHQLTNAKRNDNDIPKSSIFSPAIIFIIAATSLVLVEALLMYVVSWWKEERESPTTRRFLNFFLRNPSSKTMDDAGSIGPLDDKMVLIPEV